MDTQTSLQTVFIPLRYHSSLHGACSTLVVQNCLDQHLRLLPPVSEGRLHLPDGDVHCESLLGGAASDVLYHRTAVRQLLLVGGSEVGQSSGDLVGEIISKRCGEMNMYKKIKKDSVAAN